MNVIQAELSNMVEKMKDDFRISVRTNLNNAIDKARPEIENKLTYGTAFGVYKPFFQAPYWEVLKRVFKNSAFVTGKGIASPRNPLIMVSKEDREKIVEKEVEYMTSMLYDGFVTKNMKKLAGVVKEDSALSEFKGSVYPGTLTGFVNVKMVDGRSFGMSFSIVHKFSKNGVYFQQFPTKFHNVVLADGSKMKTPSEAKMKKGF